MRFDKIRKLKIAILNNNNIRKQRTRVKTKATHYKTNDKHYLRYNGLVSIRLIGSAMFGATFNLVTYVELVDYLNFWNTESW